MMSSGFSAIIISASSTLRVAIIIMSVMLMVNCAKSRFNFMAQKHSNRVPLKALLPSREFRKRSGWYKVVYADTLREQRPIVAWSDWDYMESVLGSDFYKSYPAERAKRHIPHQYGSFAILVQYRLGDFVQFFQICKAYFNQPAGTRRFNVDG